MSDVAAPTTAPASTPSAPSAGSSGSTPSAGAKTSGAPAAAPAAPKAMTTKDFRRHMFSQQRADQLESQGVETFDDSAERSTSLADVTDGVEAADEPVEGVEPADDDLSWAEQLREFKDGLHGVELKELLAALRDGTLPEALFDKLQLELVDGDNRWQASIADARNGAMMRSKFQKLTAQQSQREKEWASQQQEFVDYVKGWKENPELLLAGLERLGMPFDAAARLYSDRLGEVDKVWQLEQAGHVSPGTTKKLWDQQQQERELVEIKERTAREEQKRQAHAEDQQTDQAVSVIQEASAHALKSLGLDPKNKATWNIYKRHLTDTYKNAQSIPTRQDIMESAKAAKEEIAQYMAEYDGKQAKKPAAAPRNADAGAPNMGTAKPRGGPAKGLTTRDWAKKNLYRFGGGR